MLVASEGGVWSCEFWWSLMVWWKGEEVFCGLHSNLLGLFFSSLFIQILPSIIFYIPLDV